MNSFQEISLFSELENSLTLGLWKIDEPILEGPERIGNSILSKKDHTFSSKIIPLN